MVDWVNASNAPRTELAHYRVNCAVIFGVEGADQFLHAYLAQPGAVPHHVHWDCRTLVEVLGQFSFDPTQWHDVGRTDLDHTRVARRLDAYAASLCARLD